MNRKNKSTGSGAVSIQESALILGCPESVVCRLIRQGTIPTVRRRRQLLIPAFVLVRLTGGDAR